MNCNICSATGVDGVVRDPNNECKCPGGYYSLMETNPNDPKCYGKCFIF